MAELKTNDTMCQNSLTRRLILSSSSYTLEEFGLWRRPVAHSFGVGEVGGSNPLSPTIFKIYHRFS